jgi:uncharacterized membrane protein YedE/YeeE
MHEIGFTPLPGLLGGALIGAASAALLLASGRIAGISGILGGLVRAARGDRAWRAAFLAGLPIGAALATRAWSADQGFALTSSPALLVAGGLLVGLGTQIGSGCTSGHGVCGIARGSRRSIVATATFMATGVATVFVMRHVVGAP